MPIKIPKAQKKKEKKVSSKKKFLFSSPRGMHDLLDKDFEYRNKIEEATKKVASFYGFGRIETPVLEDAKIFERGTGLSSEVVSKQMFYVKSRGSEGRLALRPEMTPGVVRAYIQKGLHHILVPGKFFYISPLFRYERPQAGRFRQFWQLGFEVIQSPQAIYDAQIIIATYKICQELKIENPIIKINSIGARLSRNGYIKKLKEYYRGKTSKMCKDCQKRYKDNPLRMLDCKNERCQVFKEEAPQAIDALVGEDKNHFKQVLEYLDEVEVPYLIDHTLVRGLDYYTRTVFEVFSENYESALGGGGRYDYLSETLGGPKMAGVGSAMGIERLIDVMKAQEKPSKKKQQRQGIFLVQMGQQAKKRSLKILEMLYEAKIPVKESFTKDSMKAQLKAADKEGSRFALILGQREVFEDTILLRDMKTGNQEVVSCEKLISEVKKRLKRKR